METTDWKVIEEMFVGKTISAIYSPKPNSGSIVIEFTNGTSADIYSAELSDIIIGNNEFYLTC